MRTIGHLTSSRSRRRGLAAVGVVVAIVGGVAVWHANANAAAPPVASEYVPITPCRLADTRPAPDNVGDRDRKIGAGESVEFAVWESNGECAIRPPRQGSRRT